jgi:hypothetical protein
MGFCANCGRQRVTDARFCDGCGNDFGQPAADSGTPLAGEPVAQFRWDATADVTRLETPAAAQASAGPDPFAPWVAAPSPAREAGPSRASPADRWETADTISARPAPAPDYHPQGYPPPPWDSGAPERRSDGGKRAALIIVVVLVALAAGGGAYALVSRSNDQATGQPSDATITATASTAAPAVRPSNSPTAFANASPSTAPSASATPTPTQTGTVQIAAGVAGNQAAPRVEAFLNRYFSAINTRNYGEYNSLLDAQKQRADSQSAFDSGYATTKDSNEMLTGITGTGGGSLTANVSFTSHQSPADSPDQSACDDWQISLYLVPDGGSYVMTAVPAGYTASDTAC